MIGILIYILSLTYNTLLFKFDRNIDAIKLGKYETPVIHHIRKNTGLGIRPKHDETIPLCPGHHNMGNKSVHLNKKIFVEMFGTEQELLNEVNEKIKQLERNDIFYGKGNK